MTPKVIFNSSLPRSGSTLTQNILAQNPDFACTETSGLLELLYSARQSFTTLDEFKLSGDQEGMKNVWLGFCRGGLEGFSKSSYASIVVNKSRGWMYYYDWLQQFYPNPKILCCVRDVRAILSSMEKLHRKNMHLHDPADQPAKMQMVDIGSRVRHWLTTPPVGLGLARLRDANLKGNLAKFCVIQYDSLINEPEATMRRVYDYIEEPYFEHDFQKIEQLIPENDALHGVFGDHKVRPQLAKLGDDWDKILGTDICRQVQAEFNWVNLLR